MLSWLGWSKREDKQIITFSYSWTPALITLCSDMGVVVSAGAKEGGRTRRGWEGGGGGANIRCTDLSEVSQ